MENVIYVERLDAPPVNVKEIFRYAGVREALPEIQALVEQCIQEGAGKCSYKICYREVPLVVQEEAVDFSFSKTVSKRLATHLMGCEKAIVFSATIGIEIDRLISKYGVISPAKALVFQALGAERIESLCDAFEGKIKGIYPHVTQRFSPGYGDFSIEFQRDIFSVLDCSKRIGLSLNDSLLMSPSKSVTAVMGISQTPHNGDEGGCATCEKKDCEYRGSKCK